jgi:hypothetical protein
MCLKLLGMMPRSSGGSARPSIVCDLPAPVCPYAKMVPLKPLKIESASGGGGGGGGGEKGVSARGAARERARGGGRRMGNENGAA